MSIVRRSPLVAALRPLWATLLLPALIVTACGGTSASATSAPPASAVPTFATSSDLQATLPTSVGGVTLGSASAGAVAIFAGGTGPAYGLTLIVSDLGVSPTQVEVAAAADDAGKIQILAAKFGGVSTAAIQAEVEKLAKQADPDVTIASATIGGKSVTTYAFPKSAVQPVVSYVLEDTLYVVKSSDAALIEDALRQLP